MNSILQFIIGYIFDCTDIYTKFFTWLTLGNVSNKLCTGNKCLKWII